VGLREEKKRRQRQAIIDTAVALFREQGFEQTRVQDITGRLHISEVTFFNYFATKSSVLEAAADDMLDRATALLRQDLADTDQPVPRSMEDVVRGFAVNFSGDREFARLLAVHAWLWSAGHGQEVTHLLTPLLERGQHRGEVSCAAPAEQLAEVFMAVMLVTIRNWLQGSPEEPLDERLIRAWTIIRDGAILHSPAAEPRSPGPIGEPGPPAAARLRRAASKR
jgi:AcrR family transcriptional regulator